MSDIDKTNNFIEHIGKYYKPFDTVGALNESIQNKLLKNIVNICLFVAGLVFFLFSAFTLYKVYTTGYAILMDTRLYLLAMILMFLTDVVAVVTEGTDIKNNIDNHIKVKTSNIISISLSFIIGTVTAYLIYTSWKDYKTGIKQIAPDILLITMMKMVLAAVITFKSGQVLWEHLVKPTGELVKPIAELTKDHFLEKSAQKHFLK